VCLGAVLRTLTFLSQAIDGFIFAASRDGRFLYVSETVSLYLGLSQVCNVSLHRAQPNINVFRGCNSIWRICMAFPVNILLSDSFHGVHCSRSANFVVRSSERRLLIFDDVRRCGVVGSTIAVGSIGHGFESEHRLLSHHSASAFSKLRSLTKCSLDDSVRRLL